MQIDLVIESDGAGQRLDVAIPQACPEISRSALKSRLAGVTVNGRPSRLSARVQAGDRVCLSLQDIQELDLQPRDIPLQIIYQDQDIAVINKPAGLAVHPSPGHWDHSLVHGLLHHLQGRLSQIGGVERPGIVHRLDKDTAGLLIIALNDRAHQALSAAFKARTIHKTYEAIVQGHPPKEGEIDAPIGRSDRDRKKMAVRPGGKPALTRYRVLEYFDQAAWVEIDLLTGRTHQIRVHFSHLGHPLLGDPLYSRSGGSGLALCARRLQFTHPLSGRELSFEVALPPHFEQMLSELQNSRR